MLTWEWQRKPKPNMVTAGSKMVPRTSANRRRLKTATSRFWAVTSTAQAQQSRGSRGSGPPVRTERWAPGTSAMAWLVPAPHGCSPYSPLSCPSPGTASPHPTPNYLILECSSRIRHPHPKEQTVALDIPQAPPGRGSPPPGLRCPALPSISFPTLQLIRFTTIIKTQGFFFSCFYF